MIRKPDLLVLDEPVQGVDFSGEVALYELIRQIRDDDRLRRPADLATTCMSSWPRPTR